MKKGNSEFKTEGAEFRHTRQMRIRDVSPRGPAKLNKGRTPIAVAPPARRRCAAAPPARPLGGLDSATRDLNLDASEVRVLLELGYLVGFNIAVAKGGLRRRARRAEWRLLTRSVEQYRALRTKQRCKLEWAEIVRLLFPHDGPALRGTEVRHLLNCDHGHVENLARAGHLRVLRHSRPGPGGSCTISRASLENFLRERMG